MNNRKLVAVDSRLVAVSLIKKIGIMAALAGSISACAPSTGWRFEIGVSPVKELNNQAGLKQEPAPKERY